MKVIDFENDRNGISIYIKKLIKPSAIKKFKKFFSNSLPDYNARLSFMVDLKIIIKSLEPIVLI